MKPPRAVRVVFILALPFFACGSCDEGEAPSAKRRSPKYSPTSELDRHFPLHGLVSGIQLSIHRSPDPQSNVLGWVRIGSRIRLKRETRKSPTCQSGWHPIYPEGWLCKGEGVIIASKPPPDSLAVLPAAAAAALPYAYYKVKDQATAEFHRLPSRDEQREVQAYIDRYLDLKADDAKRALRFLKAELPDQLSKPAVLNRVLDRGFYVAGVGTEIRSQRQFLKTVSGRFLKLASLVNYKGSPFRGVRVTSSDTLPIAWAIRTAQPLSAHERADGTVAISPDSTHAEIMRHARLSWKERKRINGRVYHVLSDGTLLRDWFVSVAELIKPPRHVGTTEIWIHIDLGAQTLVLYRGTKPMYATLISTGITGHETPTGEFAIRQKRISDTMADLGGELDARYSIEDVPWTQYIKGSIALHGAFWHTRFGLKNSHGCINLAPTDAHILFDYTTPHLPLGWHGMVTQTTGTRGSLVWITD
ncbi:MAG: L,D-transpeptidase [Myxococcales bacterium]|nr:L,D-transpeptidase [Myxococcales bacterium]MCB9708830.1 L,D-transpeptidase [Myxococcales bacterium]